MEHAREMTNEVDAALERVRGELVTIERALRVLKDSIDDRGGAVGSGKVRMQSIWSAAEKASELQRCNEIDRILSKELSLPEYGALRPPDEETRSGDWAPETPRWCDLAQALQGELWLPEFGALLPSEDQV